MTPKPVWEENMKRFSFVTRKSHIRTPNIRFLVVSRRCCPRLGWQPPPVKQRTRYCPWNVLRKSCAIIVNLKKKKKRSFICGLDEKTHQSLQLLQWSALYSRVKPKTRSDYAGLDARGLVSEDTCTNMRFMMIIKTMKFIPHPRGNVQRDTKAEVNMEISNAG